MPKKSKASGGKKSRSRGKSHKKSKKGKKGKKKDDKKITSVMPDVPEPDVFIWVRRQNSSLFIEGNEDLTVKELKLMVATIYGYLPEDISLFNKTEEMLEKKDLKKKEEEKSKNGSSRASSKSSRSSSSRGGRKDKKGKGKDKRRRSTAKNANEKSEDKLAEMVQIFTLSDYGFDARSSSLFDPGEIGLVFRDKNGNFEPLDITEWTKPAEIPESVKPYLRNYNPEPEEGDPSINSVKSAANSAMKNKSMKKV